jgi:hypothetical protein
MRPRWYHQRRCDLVQYVLSLLTPLAMAAALPLDGSSGTSYACTSSTSSLRSSASQTALRGGPKPQPSHQRRRWSSRTVDCSALRPGSAVSMNVIIGVPSHNVPILVVAVAVDGHDHWSAASWDLGPGGDEGPPRSVLRALQRASKISDTEDVVV